MDKIINDDNTQRAPLKREAPVSIENPKRIPSKTPGRLKRSQDLIQDKGLEFVDNTGFQGGPSRRQGFKLALWSFYAFSVDALLTAFLTSMVFLFSSLLSKYIFGMQIYPKQMGMFAVVLFQIGIVVFWIYSVVSRTFAGCTVGEKTCDLRLGQPSQRLKADYAIKVAIRTTLSLLSGIVLLPLLSLLFKTDLAGKITGLRLISLK